LELLVILYLWTVYDTNDDAISLDCPTNGSWTASKMLGLHQQELIFTDLLLMLL
jgi:hypothetical protein